MDFNKFDARKAAETPRELHLKDPVSGELLFADGDARELPCIVLVCGSESRSAQASFRAIQKAKLTADKKSEQERSLEDLQAEVVDNAIPLIKGFVNVMRGEKAAGIGDAEWFLNLQLINGQPGEKSFVEQVTDFARKRATYLGNGSKG